MDFTSKRVFSLTKAIINEVTSKKLAKLIKSYLTKG